MNLSALYFSPRGRISRTAFWLASLPLIAPQILFVLQIKGAASPAEAVPLLILALAVKFPSLMICIKRFHDRDRAGWFALPIFMPFARFFVPG